MTHSNYTGEIMSRWMVCFFSMILACPVAAESNLVLTKDDIAMLKRLEAMQGSTQAVKELLVASQVVGPLTASGPLELAVSVGQLDLSGTAEAAMNMEVVARCRMRDVSLAYVAQSDVKGNRLKYWNKVIEAFDQGCGK